MEENTYSRAVTDSEHIIEALAEGKNKRVRKLLSKLHPAKIAALIERLDEERRAALWQQVDVGLEERILPHLRAEPRNQLRELDQEDVAPVALLDDAALQATKHGEQGHLQAIREALGEGRLKRVGKLLHRTHPAKVAGLLEALPPNERRAVWSMVDTERAGRVLTFLHEEICAALAQELDPDDLAASVQYLELDDLVDLIQVLPGEIGARLLAATGGRRRQQLETLLSYPEDSAGGLMNADPIEVRPDVRVGTVMRYLRLLDELPPQTDMLMVVGRDGCYQGGLRLSTLVTADTDERVSDLMQVEVAGIPVDMPAAEVAQLFDDLDLLSAPVVDADLHLVGRITVDDVVDRIREDADRSVMQMAGLNQDADTFGPILAGSRSRAVWLGINLVTALLAAAVISRFEATLQQLVALAVLMPIVASMGGIAGSQTLTLVIRGLALGQIQKGNMRLLFTREMGISVINGLLWAIVIGLLVFAWFDSAMLGGIIGAAILVNLLCAAAAGLTIPLLLHRLGIDPALAGGVILTTVTDVMGFFAFLGLATLWLS
ncbi:magnesium transporter [Hydrogenophaga crassostreae]|uniref:magnesium transporter n=1 Tax=Hydrogenophaga crassostreae TaxID=1763535 RepID=UPI0009EEE17D|nr:magnesium transporter [Hydrogenophaga crassostreae]